MRLIDKVKNVFFATSNLMREPALIMKISTADSVWHTKLIKQYKDLHTGFPVIDLTSLSPDFNETITSFSFLGGGSLPTDIALLQILARKFSACSYFEIGTWRGESVVNVNNYAGLTQTLNLSKQQILKLGLSERYANLHGFLSKRIKSIIHLEGNSMDFNFSNLNQKFDLIFIDGDHSYKGVKNDTEKVFEHLVHDKSIVVWHDYAYNPEKLRPEVILAILDGIPSDFKKNLYHVSNTMCAIFYREPIESYHFETPIRPDKIFNVTIKAVKL